MSAFSIPVTDLHGQTYNLSTFLACFWLNGISIGLHTMCEPHERLGAVELLPLSSWPLQPLDQPGAASDPVLDRLAPTQQFVRQGTAMSAYAACATVRYFAAWASESFEDDKSNSKNSPDLGFFRSLDTGCHIMKHLLAYNINSRSSASFRSAVSILPESS